MKTASFIWLLLIGSLSFSQNRAAIWLLGAQSVNELSPKGGIDFNSGFADTFQHIRPMGFFITNASICDTNGQLLFYTNGIFIGNKNHDTLQNSWDFNPGTYSTYDSYDGLGISQGAIVLPTNLYSHLYRLFYVTAENIFAHSDSDVQPLYLSYSEVDISMDGGLGGIPSYKKNIKIINDTISQGRLTACKHANGRDWWIIAHKYYSDIFYKLLVTPDSIYGPYQQQIGSVYTSNDIAGMAIFSPDGNKYVTVQNDNSAELYDFDRCTGEFSNPIPLTIDDIELTLGGAISSSSQFLYVNTYTSVVQFNLWSPDIQSSMIKIATWDSSYLPTATYFFLQQLAPDNKIYISTFNGTKVFHVINQPDSTGIMCNIVQHGFDLSDSRYNVCIPNFPNYDLGPLIGSPCDTLYNAITAQTANPLQLKVLPNPNHGTFTIQYHLPQMQDGEIEIVNLYGGVIATYKRPMWSSLLSVSLPTLPNGLYLVRLKSGEKTVSTKMIVE